MKLEKGFQEYSREKDFLGGRDAYGNKYINEAWALRSKTGNMLSLLYEKKGQSLHIVFSSCISSKVNRGELYVHTSMDQATTIGNSSYVPQLDGEGRFERRLSTINISLLEGFWPLVRNSHELPFVVKSLYYKAVYGNTSATSR